MNYLVDTNVLIWMSMQSSRLSEEITGILESPDNTIWFSAISILEVAIKQSLKKADFNVDPSRLRVALIAEGYHELPVTGAHAVRVLDLPLIHRDPFDRLLVAQALCEDLIVMTADHAIADYPVQNLRV
ncbi:type II toxin-antitoxin system VapC family toxin [Rhizobium sp. FKL33]|uniref:type II toxin-antitoxin system VapC family toxin n=1 Tax=Rhizobium sp. FKL33 TaxID=2562307 RepID=UPI0010C09590|nr:type II toxin-antitoxin system VapC family toxin [Rhizobium sp. FKL33]